MNLFVKHNITRPDTYIESATERYNRANIRKEKVDYVFYFIKVAIACVIASVAFIYAVLHLEVTWLSKI